LFCQKSKIKENPDKKIYQGLNIATKLIY